MISVMSTHPAVVQIDCCVRGESKADHVIQNGTMTTELNRMCYAYVISSYIMTSLLSAIYVHCGYNNNNYAHYCTTICNVIGCIILLLVTCRS